MEADKTSCGIPLDLDEKMSKVKARPRVCIRDRLELYADMAVKHIYAFLFAALLTGGLQARLCAQEAHISTVGISGNASVPDAEVPDAEVPDAAGLKP